MTADEWLRVALDSATRRELPALKPLLETLARSTARLRDADAALRRNPRTSKLQ